jgi:hypothetical protein
MRIGILPILLILCSTVYEGYKNFEGGRDSKKYSKGIKSQRMNSRPLEDLLFS